MQSINYESTVDNLTKYALAMAYVPWQKFSKPYDDLDKAYRIGTIFPELNKPFEGRRCKG